MTSSASAPASNGPRYAPPDPTLPKPWRGLIDGNTGYLYFWNPETKVTQYERPVAAVPNSPPQPPGYSRPEERPRSSTPSERSSETTVSRPQYAPLSDNRARNDHSEPHYASGVNLSQSAPSTNQVSQAASGNQMSTEAYRAKHEITIIGNESPAPFMTFQSTCFPSDILREVLQAGFSAPTPIQAQSWPIAMKGRDIVAVAKTGSGKTLGYLLPGFILLKRLHHNSREGPTVLVLSPTRELATQIQDEAIKFGRSSRISSTCLYGGAPKGPQLRELERGADVVVATPGRLNDILEMNKVSLRQVSYLVLDEADRMLDMGFEPQIRKIVKQIPPRRQTLMYTATWPKEVRKIASDLLNNPVQVNIGNTDQLVANKSITQHVEVIPHMEKSRRLDQILRSQDPGSKIIIFCSTKRMCDQLARNLSRQYGASAIHGDKSQAERDSVLNDFRSGRCPVLVATDVAARGLDIKDIRIVVNYDFPTGVEDYVHRIGRTGRAGATGSAYTFFGDQDSKYASELVKILEGANQSVPPQLKEMALRGGYGGRSRRWASSDDSYGSQGYGAKRSTDSFKNSSFGNQAGGGSSFHSSFHNSSSGNQFGDTTSFHASYGNSSQNNQTGDNPSFPPSNNQSGDGLSFHERFYGSRGRDESRSNNDGFRARSRSPGKPVEVSNW
uniref:RNA helicase n=1 Tax=Zea mays TaxID=4577 RepID=A0A804MZA3_MAIZE